MKRAGVALIDESRCIGCTLLHRRLPGGRHRRRAQLMHTVVEPWCIGCELCLPPCPVDCIDMVPARGEWTAALKRAAGERGRRRKKRLDRKRSPRRTTDRKAVLAAVLASAR